MLNVVLFIHSVSRQSQLGPFFGYFPNMFGSTAGTSTPCPAPNSTCSPCNAPAATATLTTGNLTDV